jgi:hypothetical protein
MWILRIGVINMTFRDIVGSRLGREVIDNQSSSITNTFKKDVVTILNDSLLCLMATQIDLGMVMEGPV